jgi:hypothetical protein
VPAQPPTGEDEVEELRAQADWLQRELDTVNKRIEQVKKESE